jgi:gamma-glutamyl:cysteine ligase YbdK (ATP-grasp superfamily)
MEVMPRDKDPLAGKSVAPPLCAVPYTLGAVSHNCVKYGRAFGCRSCACGTHPCTGVLKQPFARVNQRLLPALQTETMRCQSSRQKAATGSGGK